MNFLRNNEVSKILKLQIFISISAIVAAFIWDNRFGIFTLIFAMLLLVCAPWARSNGCKSRTCPGSGKCIAEQQGCSS